MVDPDRKVYMSLDDIIETWGEGPVISRRERREKPEGRRKENKDHQYKNRDNSNYDDGYSSHSIPLQIGGGRIYVTKKSPLLKSYKQQDIVRGMSNRFLNMDLLRKKTKIIPAKYELIKTDTGVERILVPVPMFNRRRKRKKKKHYSFSTKSDANSEPPPLLPLPNNFFSQIGSLFCNKNEINMEVDESDDDVVVLETKIGQNKSQNHLVIDVESNKIINGMIDNPPKKTLHERFSMLNSPTII